MIKSGVYQIININNSKRYIGSSVDMRVRFRSHLWLLRKNQHQSQKLQNAWNKHGSNFFCFEVIEFVEDLSELSNREQYWLDHYQSASNNGYNIKPVAYSNVGFKLPQSTKDKIAAKATGRKVSLDLIHKWSAARIGKKHSQETIEKIRQSRRGRLMSDESRRKISEAATGRTASESTKRLMSLAHSGKTQSAEHIRKRVEKQLGQKRSEESKMRMSEAQKKRFRESDPNRGSNGSFAAS